MAENDTFNQFSRENLDAERYSLSAFAKMNLFRKRGQLCDVVVKVGGRVFPAHRIVLAASSDYFGAMFSNGMAESAQLEIELKSVSSDVMEALLDFVYTGQVRVSMENVQELLPAASLVQMEGVKTVCSAFLFGQVEASNVLGIRRFAELHSCTDLEVFAKNYAAHNFNSVVEFEEFLFMNADELVELLIREDLHIDSEETAYNAVIRWVYYDELNRVVHLPNLLNYVRLAIMSVRFLTDIVDNERLIRQSLECRDLVDEAKRFHLRPDLRSQMHQSRFHQRDGGDEYLVVIGGFGSYQSPSDSVEMFNPRTCEWSELPNLPISYRYVAACSLGTCVYVIGGFDGGERLNTVGLLDVAQREDGWRWLAPMHYKRGLSAACTHKGLIYVCGGFDGQTRLRALEVYHPKIDEWRVLEEMTTAREGAGLVVADDTLFCLGGYNGFQLLNSMEAFDLRRGTWSQCKPMYMRRSGAGCAVIVDTLYVCGGYGGPEGRGPLHLDTVEAYNTRLAQWTLVANMNVPRCYVGACQLAGRVYVAAGYNGHRLLNTVEAFNPVDNIWTLYEESRMHNERCDTGVCVVRFLSCAEPPTSGGGGPATPFNQPRKTACTHRSRGSATSANGDGSVQTQAVQIVTPIFQSHANQSELPTPPPNSLQSVVGNNHQLLHLPESTGAPPISSQRAMPSRDGILEPTLPSVRMSAIFHTELSFVDDGTDQGATVDIDEQRSQRIVQPIDLNNELESLADSSLVTSTLTAPANEGDGASTLVVHLNFQHPDGAATEDDDVNLMLSQSSLSDANGGRIEEGAEEEDVNKTDEENVSSSPPRIVAACSPGLILEDMGAHLQHRITFLRGRESSSSQDFLLIDDSRSGEALEDSDQTDTQCLGRSPSASVVPSSSADSLLWIRCHQHRRIASSLSHQSAHAQMIACSQSCDCSGTIGEVASRSDGEGEEGEGEGIMSRTGMSIGAGVPQQESLGLSSVTPPILTPHNPPPPGSSVDI